MTFTQSISTCFEKYATWEGRAQRSEFWFFMLFSVLVIVGSLLVGQVFGESGAIVLMCIAILALILPSLAVTIRRLHDQNKSGWWYWIGIIPYVGGIVLFVFYCLEGTKGENDYGVRDNELAAY